MSLVGPRPHVPGMLLRICLLKTSCVHFNDIRRAGITGLAQVSGCRGSTAESSRAISRIDYDLSTSRMVVAHGRRDHRTYDPQEFCRKRLLINLGFDTVSTSIHWTIAMVMMGRGPYSSCSPVGATGCGFGAFA